MVDRNLLEVQQFISSKSACPNYQESKESVNPELLATKGFLQYLLGKMAEGILFIQMDGTIRVINEAAQKLIHRSADGLLLQPFWNVFPDGYFGFSMREALRYGIAQKQLFLTLLGREVEVTSSFLYEGPKEHQGLAIMLFDLTDKKKCQQALARTDRMKELGEMAAALAHEIRNPLGAMRGFAMLLVRDLKDHSSMQQMAQHIVDGTKTLETAVTQVLQYARPLEVSLRTVNLGDKLRDIAKFAKADPAFPANVKLALHIPDEPVLAAIDGEALKRALLNLLINGWQAMPQGGLLTLSLLKTNTSCQISVVDTGAGIPEEILGQVFSPLFTTKQAGNGLGLVETKKIVEAHGGTIDVRSRVGVGTTFTIALKVL